MACNLLLFQENSFASEAVVLSLSRNHSSEISTSPQDMLQLTFDVSGERSILICKIGNDEYSVPQVSDRLGSTLRPEVEPQRSCNQ
jgi:hypothetical protein